MKTTRQYITLISALVFSVISIAALWITGVNPYDLIMAAWWPVLMVFQFSLILLWFTSIPNRLILLSLGMGASAIPLITYLIQKPLSLLIQGSALENLLSGSAFFNTIDLTAPVLAPITEETIKLIPVLFIFLLLMRYKKYRLLSPVDFALLGLAAGAGFDIFENLCRAYNGFYDMNGLYRSVVNEPLPSILGIYLFPTLYKSEYLGNPMLWFGHAGLTGTISLALGFFVYLKKKRYLFLPILVTVIAIIDHSMWNWYQPMPEQNWAKIVPSLTLHGRLLPLLFIAGLLFSIYLITRNKKRFNNELSRIRPPIDGYKNLCHRITIKIAYNKSKNQLTNAFWHYLIKGIKEEPFDVVVDEILKLYSQPPEKEAVI